MTWHDPITWTTNQLVTATNLNEQIRDNANWLAFPNRARVLTGAAEADFTTTSTSFTDVDATAFGSSYTVENSDADVLVVAMFNVRCAGGRVHFDITIDSVAQGATDGLAIVQTVDADLSTPVCLFYIARGLSAGAHTCRLQWKTDGTTARILRSTTTASYLTRALWYVGEL